MSYMSWSDDSSIPVGHHDIVAIFETVRTGAIADSLFTFFEFFEEFKVTWDWDDESDCFPYVCCVI